MDTYQNGENAKRAMRAVMGERLIALLSVFMIPIVTAVVVWIIGIDDRIDEINLRISVHENEDKAMHAQLERLERDLEAYIKPFPSQSVTPRGVLRRE